MTEKVIFNLQSDVLCCGINTESNFLISEDSISGSVLRAAYAKQIYLECDIENRDNIINIKDENKCSKCKYYKVCKSFSDMTFSFLYKKDCLPAPLTTMKCKLNSSHPLKDVMLRQGNMICEKCRSINEKSGRMEDAKGFVNLDVMGVEKVKKSTTTHTAVNYNLRIALSQSLFTTRAIEAGQKFQGYIDDCESGMLKLIPTVYVGKYSSSGFGKIQLSECSQIKDDKNLKSEIEKFTQLYKGENEKMYVPLLFLSDAKLDIKPDEQAHSDNEYKKIWQTHLFGDTDIFKVETVYAQNRILSGYDTSKKWNEWKKQPEILTVKGSSFLISFPKNDFEKALEILKKLVLCGIGKETKNGFGKIEICNKLHLTGSKI